MPDIDEIKRKLAELETQGFPVQGFRDKWAQQLEKQEEGAKAPDGQMSAQSTRKEDTGSVITKGQLSRREKDQRRRKWKLAVAGLIPVLIAAVIVPIVLFSGGKSDDADEPVGQTTPEMTSSSPKTTAPIVTLSTPAETAAVIPMPHTYSISTLVSPEGGGEVAISPNAASYTEGTNIQLTALPSPGYEFDFWGGDASGNSATSTVTVNADLYVTANFKKQQYTLSVASSPSQGGSINPDGGIYYYGNNVAVLAIPATGWEFYMWGGDASGQTSSTSILMDSNKSITAYFTEKPPEQYTLSVSANPSNGGYVTPSGGSYEEGDGVTLTATPKSGYQFDHWGGSASGYSSSISLTMNSDKSVTAYFEEIPPEQYTLTVSCSPSNGGYVTPSGGSYEEGDGVTLTATPKSGYQFDRWGGSASGYSSSISLTMNSDKSVTAYFEEIPPEQYTLTVSCSPSEGGYVSPSGGSYEEGDGVTLTATPKSGYQFDRWGGSASGYSSSISLTMNSDKSIVAYFEPQDQHIEYTLDGRSMREQWVWWSKWLNAGEEVRGTLEITGYYPSIDWDSTCWFDVFDPENDIIYSWQDEFEKSGISHEFEFTAPSSGQYDIQVKSGSNHDRDIVIDISPDGWS